MCSNPEALSSSKSNHVRRGAHKWFITIISSNWAVKLIRFYCSEAPWVHYANELCKSMSERKQAGRQALEWVIEACASAAAVWIAIEREWHDICFKYSRITWCSECFSPVTCTIQSFVLVSLWEILRYGEIWAIIGYFIFLLERIAPARFLLLLNVLGNLISLPPLSPLFLPATLVPNNPAHFLVRCCTFHPNSHHHQNWRDHLSPRLIRILNKSAGCWRWWKECKASDSIPIRISLSQSTGLG